MRFAFLCALLIGPIFQPSAASAEDQCGTILTPHDIATLRQLDSANAPLTPRGDQPLYYVPIAFHVVRQNNGTGGLTPGQICESMELLDASYLSMNIQFYLLGPVDYIDNDNFYSGINTMAEINALRTTNLVANAVNLYCTPVLDYESGALCGISAFTSSSVQSIALRNSCMPPTNYSTLPHEVGHYFNLYHTHETAFGREFVNGTNCTTRGDLVCDTPADPTLGTSNVTPAPGCVYTGTSTDQNGDPYQPDPHNFMSYAPKACRDIFSNGQNSRAYTTLVNSRPELANPALPGPPDCNNNSVRDACDIAQGTSTDCDSNGLPDDCQADCDADGLIDACDTAGDINGDAAVNQADVDLFIAVLVGADTNALHIANSDLTCDGLRNAADIPRLVDSLVP